MTHISRPTINQINGFAARNPVLHHFIQWRDNINLLKPAWREYITDSRYRDLPRNTLRGNCIYGNLLKTVAAYSKININEYNYHRDNLNFEFSVQWSVKLDVDGVWISARLPWNEDKDAWTTPTFVRERMRADVPFERASIAKIVERYDRKYFFPEDTVLGKIQARFRKSKKQAVELFKQALAEKKNIPAPADIEDSCVQRAMARKLKRAKNISPEIHLSKAQFNFLMARKRAKTLQYARKFDMDFMLEFDGDIDELEDEFYRNCEDNVVYV